MDLINVQQYQLPYISVAPQKAKPFLKWAGGKTQLLPQFEDLYPTELKRGKIERYIEPFIGGGAVFFEIVQKYHVVSAFLYDINVELILVYRVVQQDPFRLLEELDGYSRKYKILNAAERKDFFYSTREEFNSRRSQIDFQLFSEEWVSRAAMLLFLNRTCYNGLFRLNSKGEFNVPHGKYKNPKIVDAENIQNASNVLQIADIRLGDFEDCGETVDTKTFVYFDPPYRPISQTASFTAYSKYSFGDKEQTRLARFFSRLDEERGAKLMLSNSDPTNKNPGDIFFDDLYRNFNIHRISAHRMINSNGAKRGKIRELLVTNYETT